METKIADKIERKFNVIVDPKYNVYKIGGSINDENGWMPIPPEWINDMLLNSSNSSEEE